jgi:curli production assembly/transport component CsgG
MDPRNAIAYSNRSAAYAQKNFLNKALKDSNEAIRIDPDFSLAYNNRGYVFELLGSNKKAAADYLKSCSLGLDLGCKNFERLDQSP